MESNSRMEKKYQTKFYKVRKKVRGKGERSNMFYNTLCPETDFENKVRGKRKTTLKQEKKNHKEKNQEKTSKQRKLLTQIEKLWEEKEEET